MEHQASIRSSQVRGNSVRLRRTDQTLHETTQRFVESLSKDIRISQFADPEYASKKLETDIWYWLTPVDSGRPGYLVFLPNQPAIWIDEVFRQSFCIPIRVSQSVHQQKSVCIASLDKQDSLLRLEDAWMINGEFLRSKSFSNRWNKLLDFFTSHYKKDSILQQGLRIDLAEFSKLSDFETIMNSMNSPSNLYAQGETSPRRLRICFQPYVKQPVPQKVQETPSGSRPVPYTRTPVSTHSKSKSPSVTKTNPLQKSPSNDLDPSLTHTSTKEDTDTLEGKQRAILTPHDTYPDTYYITIHNQKKGYAAVQDLDLSIELTKRVEQKLPLTATVEWNSEFNMYEICNV